MPPVADGRTTVAAPIPAVAELVGELQPGKHLAGRADRSRPADADDERPPAGGPDLGGDPLDGRRPFGPVVGRGDVDRGAEQLVEPLVRAFLAGRERRAGEDEMDGEPGPRAGRGGEPAMVGPAPAGRDQRVGALRQRLTDEELQVPQLVAAEREGQEVLALDPDVRAAAERRREALEPAERRRPVEQRGSAAARRSRAG